MKNRSFCTLSSSLDSDDVALQIGFNLCERGKQVSSSSLRSLCPCEKEHKNLFADG